MEYKVLKALHKKGKKTIQVGTILEVPKDLTKVAAEILAEKKVIEEIKNAKK